MYSSVPYKRVSTGYTTKRHKPRKPWWNSTLTDLWSRLSQDERSWLKSRGGSSEKARLKSAYVTLRKSFDREVQRYKRLHWYNLQSELEQECNIDHTRFWKSIGKIGVKSAKRNLIPCEIITNDGSVSQETDEVLNKWKSDFCNLLNCSANTGSDVRPDEYHAPSEQVPDEMTRACTYLKIIFLYWKF